MEPPTQFAFGTHRDHGLVAGFTHRIPAHLGDWFLKRLQFEPVAGEQGLYRLTEPDRDGLRRTHQAAQALRAQGYAVYLDANIAPATPAGANPSRSPVSTERRGRIAQLAGVRSHTPRSAPATNPPSRRPVPVPAVRMTEPVARRTR